MKWWKMQVSSSHHPVNFNASKIHYVFLWFLFIYFIFLVAIGWCGQFQPLTIFVLSSIVSISQTPPRSVCSSCCVVCFIFAILKWYFENIIFMILPHKLLTMNLRYPYCVICTCMLLKGEVAPCHLCTNFQVTFTSSVSWAGSTFLERSKSAFFFFFANFTARLWTIYALVIPARQVVGCAMALAITFHYFCGKAKRVLKTMTAFWYREEEFFIEYNNISVIFLWYLHLGIQVASWT